MKVYDISLTLSESIPTWPGDRGAEFKKLMEVSKGDMASVTAIKMSAYTGTHVDAPCHFLENGYGVEKLPLNILMGEALVVEALDVDLITKEVLEGIGFPSTQRLLIKTRNSKQWEEGATTFIEDYVAISADGADYLVKRGVKLIGVDYLSVAPFQALVETHQILLKADVIILEGINLSEVPSGKYQLYCLPLKISGSDGAPARAILL
ncbi:MAG: cyclase family protein [Chlamydiia bacterium]|nr:cyclase family protein [Chlamydiia bacterium]